MKSNQFECVLNKQGLG